MRIAKTEYRLTTSRIRGFRPYLPYGIIAGIMIWVFWIAPSIIDMFSDDIEAIFLSQVAVAMIQILLLMIFMMLVTFPLASTLQEVKTEQLELVLSSPIKPRDLLIGEFLGLVPFYVIFAGLFGGLFTAALVPLGLDVIQVLIILFIFFLIFSSALWIGTVTAILLRTVLAKSPRGNDIGKGLAMLVVIPPIFIIYALVGGYMDALQNPETAELVQNILTYFPSSWGSGVIVEFAKNPGNILTVSSGAVMQFFGLILFFVGSLWIGGSNLVSKRAYNLEPSTFSASKASPNSRFYSIIKRIGGGGSTGVLLSSSFKSFFRTVKNLTKIAYVLALVTAIMIFLLDDANGGNMPYVATLVMTNLLSAFATSDITLQGKENLLIFKQTPSSSYRLVKIKLVQNLLIVIPLTSIASIFVTSRAIDSTTEMILTNLGLNLITSVVIVVFYLGLYLFNPVWDEKSFANPINIQIGVFAIIMSFVFLMIGFGIVLNLGYWIAALAHSGLVGILGIILLFLGIKNLNKLD
jgi:hypothetical protein